MIKNKVISIPIDDDMVCHLDVLFDPEKLAKRYTVNSLTIGSEYVATSWSQLADFSEMFNAFSKNCLTKDVKYKRHDYYFAFQHENGKAPVFAIAILDEENQEKWKFFKFTKERTLLVYNKLTKILNKCDFGD